MQIKLMVFLEWTWYELNGIVHYSVNNITDVYVNEHHHWLLLAFGVDNGVYRLYEDSVVAIEKTFQEI